MTNSAKVTAILISGIAVVFAAQFGTIALRRHRNQPAAKAIAESLASRYPNYRITGTASYEREVIYISVWGRPENATQLEIRDWLADEKHRRQLRARVSLIFVDPKTVDALAEYDF
jgi:hypothetical protein